MTKHPFSDKAIEAAAKAICEKHGRKWDMEFSFNSETRDWWIEEAEAALSAAFEYARGEGNARSGAGVIWHKEQPNEVWLCKTVPTIGLAIPVTIIKDAAK